MANDDLKASREAGEPPANGRGRRPDAQLASGNGDDAIEVAALSGRDATELGGSNRERPGFRNQIED